MIIALGILFAAGGFAAGSVYGYARDGTLNGRAPFTAIAGGVAGALTGVAVGLLS